MFPTHTDDTLPAAQRLPARQQVRLLGFAVIGLAVLALVFWLVSMLLTPAPEQPPVDPPGTFRPTQEQLATLSFEKVGSGLAEQITTASGSIVADGDLSTPVLLPYSGQVMKVLVDAGQVVTAGQPLLTIRTTDFVDARNTLFSAEATWRSAQAALLNARRNAERAKALVETAGGARKDYQQALTDLAAAEAQERSAEAAVGAARDKLAILGKSAGCMRSPHFTRPSAARSRCAMSPPANMSAWAATSRCSPSPMPRACGCRRRSPKAMPPASMSATRSMSSRPRGRGASSAQ